ncbi:MAG: 30S ribosome-binding factor RbfA [Endomicrobiales bacterium]|nr:30S ribosome-binding factor RbfA [Endomicrobiales bacterium]
MQNYKRSTRVGEQIQQEISKIVQEIKDPEFGFVTITGIKLTDDLLSARIFYSVLGSPEEVKRSCQILEEQLKHIRHELAVRLNLRRTPDLTLEYDHTPEKANRVFEILENLKKEDQK